LEKWFRINICKKEGIMSNTETVIIYKKSFVAYLDVLGFQSMVRGNEEIKINQYFRIVNETITALKKIKSKAKIGSIIISDSIILTVCVDTNDIEEKKYLLRQLCIAVKTIQYQLALYDVWLRGAVTYGNVFFNEDMNQIVGPAYMDAYLLEEKIALYPRVILDSKLVKDLYCETASEFINMLNNHDFYGNIGSEKDRNILFSWIKLDNFETTIINQDIPLFINYLIPDKYDDLKEFNTIINIIRENLYKNITFYKKYRWLADYLLSITYIQTIYGSPYSNKIVNLLRQL